MRLSQGVLYPITRLSSRLLYRRAIFNEIYEKHTALERYFHRRYYFLLSIRGGESVSFRRFLRLEFSKHPPRGKREPFHVHHRWFYPLTPSKSESAFLFFIFAFIRGNATLRNT